MRSLILILALSLFLLTPLQAGDAPAAATSTSASHGTDCAPKGPEGVPEIPHLLEDLAALEAVLVDLHARFAHLDGFIDVHVVPAEARWVALFEEAVPQGAAEVETPVPVGFHAITAPAPETGKAEAAPTVNDVLCPGIRPGARITVGNSVCTLGFLYRDGATIYATTAGHCIAVGQSASIAGVGIIGSAVYSTGSGGPGNDFAIIEILSSKTGHVDPAMCAYGGPDHARETSVFGLSILHNGHGGGLIQAPPRPKAGVGITWGAYSFSWVGTGIPGDSGSAVETGGGGAIGVLTHVGVGIISGTNVGQRAGPSLDRAGYGHLDLMMAPMSVP